MDISIGGSHYIGVQAKVKYSSRRVATPKSLRKYTTKYAT